MLSCSDDDDDDDFPDPLREDLQSRSPNLGPHTTKGTLYEPPLRDLLFGSSRGSGLRPSSDGLPPIV